MALKIIREQQTWNLHTHSKHSAQDALPTVTDIVDTVSGFGQKAIGLTDHGNMGGTVQLYKEAAKAGIKPFPGTEIYIVQSREDGKAKRHHMCVVAYTTQGYKNLVAMNTLANKNMHFKPLIDFADLAALSSDGMLEGIAGTSGCYFGYIAQAVSRGDDAEAKRLMMLMDKWFPKFYVESQNHFITHDEETGVNDNMLAESLMVMAGELGIPTILTQDSHYISPEDQVHHDTLKRIVAWGDQPDDAVFPGDGFHLATDGFFKDHHNQNRYERGLEGLQDLYDSHDLAIPELDTYHYRIPFTVPDPDKALKTRALNALTDMGLADTLRYANRLVDELEIVEETGQAGYLMLVAAVTDWLRKEKIFYQARGSASGSLLCWMLGITQVDPLKYKLGFSRFISRDRTKPADIDLDIEHHMRDALIAMLSKSYAVMQIGTWMEMGMSDDDDGGSLVVKYYSQNNRRSGVDKIHTWKDIPKVDQDALIALGKVRPFSTHGTHAAGLIVASTQSEIDDLIPSMRVGKKADPRYVSQYDMDDVEALGFVKLDVLGSKTMTILKEAMINLGRDPEHGLEWIPKSDSATYTMISKGQTDGVFQLEGGSARRGVRELQPTKLDDIIASMALFRPATMNSGATKAYIGRKQKELRIPEHSPVIKTATLKTYGTIIYQDQVIDCLREIGMDPDNLTAFLKAVKASNASIGSAGKVIAQYEVMVRGMAEAHGITGDEWKWFWEAVSGFAAYSFNLAHSTVYGLTAYRCAYLAKHHTTEFFAAVLSVWAGDKKKEPPYIRAARNRGIKFRKPSLNKSGVRYTVVREGVILKGLMSMSGIGETTAAKIVAARPKEGFQSIDDFCQRVGGSVSGVVAYKKTGDTQTGIFGKMYEAGMFNYFDGA